MVMKSFSPKMEDRQDAIKNAWTGITYLAGATGGAAMLIFLHAKLSFQPR
jgi:hypothetical protein